MALITKGVRESESRTGTRLVSPRPEAPKKKKRPLDKHISKLDFKYCSDYLVLYIAFRSDWKPIKRKITQF